MQSDRSWDCNHLGPLLSCNIQDGSFSMPGTLVRMARRWGSARMLGWLGLYLYVVFGLSLHMASPPVSRERCKNGLLTPLVSKSGYKSRLPIWCLRIPKSRSCQTFLKLSSRMAQHPFYLILVVKANNRASLDLISMRLCKNINAERHD